MSIIERAVDELRRIGFGEEDTTRMVEILELFFGQWDSGGAVSAVAPILQKCIAGKPLSPLTGEDDEWFYPQEDVPTQQNKRCSTVFRERLMDGSWRAYDIDLPTVGGQWSPITFPYTPKYDDVRPPVIAVRQNLPAGAGFSIMGSDIREDEIRRLELDLCRRITKMGGVLGERKEVRTDDGLAIEYVVVPDVAP